MVWAAEVESYRCPRFADKYLVSMMILFAFHAASELIGCSGLPESGSKRSRTVIALQRDYQSRVPL